MWRICYDYFLFYIGILLGGPNEKIWNGVSDLPAFTNGIYNLAALAEKYKYDHLPERICPYVHDSNHTNLDKRENLAVEFANSLLTYDPDLRSTARESLHHPYFKHSPLPTAMELMPTFPLEQWAY